MEGKYFLSLAIHNQDHTVQYHRREDWHPFAVKNPTAAHGVVHLDCTWAHKAG
jgi:ABC-2 type transport system ATP-binding protein/lipopolysaccharide transport system ATP-binding protein